MKCQGPFTNKDIDKSLDASMPELSRDAEQEIRAVLRNQADGKAGIDLKSAKCCCLFGLPEKPGNRKQISAVFGSDQYEIQVRLWGRLKVSKHAQDSLEDVVSRTKASIRASFPDLSKTIVGAAIEAASSRQDADGPNFEVRVTRIPDWGGRSLRQVVRSAAAAAADETVTRAEEALKAHLQAGVAALPSVPGWAVPGTDVSCQIRLKFDSTSCMTLTCTADILYGRTVSVSVSRAGKPLLEQAGALDLEPLTELIQQQYRSLADGAFAELQACLPACIVPPPAEGEQEGTAEGEGFPAPLWDLLLTGQTEVGPLTAVSDLLRTPEENCRAPGGKTDIPLLCCLDSSGGLYLSSHALSRKRRTVSIPAGWTAGSGPVQADSLQGAWLLLQSLAEQYEAEDFGELEKPSVTVGLAGCRIDSVTLSTEGLHAKVPDTGDLLTEDRIAAWTGTLIRDIWQRVWNLAHEAEIQTRILSEQNPAVLAIIRHAYAKGRTNLSDLNSSIGDSMQTARASTEYYLLQATQLQLPSRGTMMPALNRVLVDGTYQKYYGYYPSCKISDGVLESVEPAPFTLEDLPRLKPASRDRWLVEQAGAADTAEKQQEVLGALREGIPRTVAADFCRSAEGQAFLGRLTGAEADAAREVLKTLPGCRRAAETVGQAVSSEGDSGQTAQTAFLTRRPAIARVKVKDYLASYTLAHLIEAGRKLERKFVIHCGPTNSGKTYQALQVLRGASCGVYLGPLRLLALEVFDTLNGDGCPCTLLTGEELQQTEGARVTASTIEMADYGTWYDVAVIDECQMLEDPERGCHWLKAVALLAASEIHLCTAPQGLQILENLLDRLGASWTVQQHQRLAPLSWAGDFRSLEDVEPGDALITFSRRSVLGIAAELEHLGVSASVIYGALPPQSRREEVRRFRDGETTAVVATDAIGMGISLPIRRIIFCQAKKFNGEYVRPLLDSEIQQIAGRAGRYGIYPEGFVLSMEDPSMIRNGIRAEPVSIRKVILPFPEEALDTKYKLSTMLRAWNDMPVETGVERADMSNARCLLRYLESSLPKDLTPDRRQMYSLITCPVDSQNRDLREYWYECCCAILRGRPVPKPDFPEETLAECEEKYRALDIQHQMGRRGGVEIDNMREKNALSEKINTFLRAQKFQFQRRCSSCGRLLPINTIYGMCQECYEARQYRRWW